MDDSHLADSARIERLAHALPFAHIGHFMSRQRDGDAEQPGAFDTGVHRFREVHSDELLDEATLVRAESAEHSATAGSARPMRPMPSSRSGHFFHAPSHGDNGSGMHGRIVPADESPPPPPPPQTAGATHGKRQRGAHNLNRKQWREREKAELKEAKAAEAQQRSREAAQRRAEVRNKGKQPAAHSADANTQRQQTMAFESIAAQLQALGVEATLVDPVSTHLDLTREQERELREHQQRFEREAARIQHGMGPSFVWTPAQHSSGDASEHSQHAGDIHLPGLEQQQSLLRAIQIAQLRQQESSMHAMQSAHMAELAELAGLLQDNKVPVADDSDSDISAAEVAGTRSSTPSVRSERQAPLPSGDEDAASSKASGVGAAVEEEVALTPEERERARRAAKRSRQKKKDREDKKAQAQASKAAKANDKIMSRANRKKSAAKKDAEKPAASPTLPTNEQQHQHAAAGSPSGSSRASTPTKLEILSKLERPTASAPAPRDTKQSSSVPPAQREATSSDPVSEVSIRSPKGGLKGALTAPSTPVNWSVDMLVVDTADVPELEALSTKLSQAAALDLAYDEQVFKPHERIRGDPLRAARSFRTTMSDSARGEQDDGSEMELAFLEECAAATSRKLPEPAAHAEVDQVREPFAAPFFVSNGAHHEDEESGGIQAHESRQNDCNIGAEEALDAADVPLPASSSSVGSLNSPATPSLSMLPALPPSPISSDSFEARSVAGVEALPSPAMSRPGLRSSGDEAIYSSTTEAEAQASPSDADSGDEGDVDSDADQAPEQGSVSVHFENTASDVDDNYDDEEQRSDDEHIAEQDHRMHVESTEGELRDEAMRLQGTSRQIFGAMFQHGLRQAEVPSPIYYGSFCYELINRHGESEFTGISVDIDDAELHEYEEATESGQSLSSADERVEDSSSEAEHRLPRGISASTLAHTTPDASPESHMRGRARSSKPLTGGELPLLAAGGGGVSARHADSDEAETYSSDTIEDDTPSDSSDEPLRPRLAGQAAGGRGTASQAVSASQQTDQGVAAPRGRYVPDELDAPLDRQVVRRTGSVNQDGGGPLQLFGSRWRTGKVREKIYSNRPDPENLTRNNARNAEGQLISPTVLNEVAPLRLHSGGEHKYLPRPKVAKNLLSRQVGVRLPETEPAADRLRLMLCSTGTQRGRAARPWAASAAPTPAAIESPPVQALLTERPPDPPVQVGAGLDQLD